MTKYKRKPFPAEPYEIDALESWFSELSAEGLHLYSANALYATFAEGEKKHLLYRMEPKKSSIFSNWDESRLEKQNAQHKEKGWNFVCALNRFYVYAAEEGTADYFATPEEEGAYYPDNLKGNKPLNSRYAELLIDVLLIAIYIFILYRQSAYDWVDGSANIFFNFPVFIFAVFVGQRNRGMIKLQNSLAAGELHHQPTDWQAPHLRWKHLLYYVCFTMMTASFFLPLLPYAFHFSDKPMAEVRKPLPMISLAEPENDPDFYAVDTYYQRDSDSKEDRWEREANLVSSYPTFGSPVDLCYNQAGRIPNQTDAVGEPYESVLWVEYRRLAPFVSPKEYLEEYIEHWDSLYTEYECSVPEDTPFDYAFLAKSENRTELYLISGQQLLELDYSYGNVDLTAHYDLYEKALKEIQ